MPLVVVAVVELGKIAGESVEGGQAHGRRGRTCAVEEYTWITDV
jgi:hypothetical protein